MMGAMRRPFGRIGERQGVDEPGYVPPQEIAPDGEGAGQQQATRYAMNPLAVGLAVLGGILLALSCSCLLSSPIAS
jgi:hypothetical protein